MIGFDIKKLLTRAERSSKHS